jgi:hypothetical protein
MSDLNQKRREFNALEHSVPMRSVDSVLLAWEVLDCYEQRRAMEEANREGLAYGQVTGMRRHAWRRPCWPRSSKRFCATRARSAN